MNALICHAVRTPVGKYAGALSKIRIDDLAAIPIQALIARHPQLDPESIDDVILGCANQAGEDNRNIARMAALLTDLPPTVPGITVNRLCGSGLDAIAIAARAIALNEANLIIAGGVESMSRAPYVFSKSSEPFSRNLELHDTTLGWRFVNPRMHERYGTDALSQTAENLAIEQNITREDQDRFAFGSQQKTASAQNDGRLAEELVAVSIPQKKQEPLLVERDEYPRSTSLEKLAQLPPLLGPGTTITAGNSSGINDGAAALLVASEQAAHDHELTPLARILGTAVTGVLPRTMGIGPVPATQKLLRRFHLSLDDIDIIEINEAFAAQVLACTRLLGLSDDDPRVNPLGGAISLGHPLGMSGARLATTAVHQLQHTRSRYALCTMCIGVGQGIATLLERV